MAIPPRITMDDGADLVSLLHTKRTDLAPGIIGGTEETTTGVIRLKSMEASGVLRYHAQFTTTPAPRGPTTVA